MRETISVESRIAMSLQRLGTGNTLCTVGEVYAVAESTILEIVRNFCRLVRVHLQGTFVQFPNPAQFRILAQEFKALNGIPYIIEAVDGSHIPILAPVIGGEDYYCRKSFHSALLQGIVDTKCVFWDYEFGWVGSMHDWTLFQLTKVGRDCIKEKFLPYKLIGDCTYPVRSWIYNPFKGCAEGLEGYKANWNFIQSSTRMCVERAFGILKGRWRIIMRRADIPLRYMADVVCTCIILHNMCTIGKNKFDMEWIEEAERELCRRINSRILREGQEMRAELAALGEVKNISNIENSGRRAKDLDKDTEFFLIKENDKDEDLLLEATNMHIAMAKSLWQIKLQKNTNVVFQDMDTDSDMSE
jgi:hypothetical protein